MNVDEIRKFCLAFSEATEKLQWGDALCFKVRGKMFAALGLDDQRFTFKCTPEKFSELIEYDGICPAPYVGRYKWVMLDRLDALQWNELQSLIGKSYEMVAAKAPGKKPRKRKRTTKSASLKKKKEELKIRL